MNTNNWILETENQVLRDRVKKNRAAARRVFDMLPKYGYFSAKERKEIEGVLWEIIKGE